MREADFINCVAWRSTADFVHKYFIKGNKIGLRGSLQTRSYDAQDGSKRYVTEVIADEVEFVTSKSDGQNSGQYSGSAPAPVYGQQGYSQQPVCGQPSPQQRTEQMRMDTNGFTEVDDDELPF